MDTSVEDEYIETIEELLRALHHYQEFMKQNDLTEDMFCDYMYKVRRAYH